MNEINKNWYWKVNSQEEANRLLDWLETHGNKCYRGLGYCKEWGNVGFSLINNDWQLIYSDYISQNPQLILQSKFPWEELTTPEELLEEAKRRYPVGTTYKCASDGNISNTVSIQDFKIHSKDVIYGEFGKGCLYYKGKWAEIVSSSDSKESIDNEETICETCNGTGQVMVAKLYPSGHTEVKEDCPDCNGTGYIETKSDNSIPKFEVGKWYKYNDWYIKYDRHYQGGWIASEEINSEGRYSKIQGVFGGRESDNLKILLTDLSEIQQYLPNGHIDKFPTSDSIPEYVEFLSNDFSNFTNGKIYPLNKDGWCMRNDGTYSESLIYPEEKKFLKPSTKEAYDAQNSVKPIESVKSSKKIDSINSPKPVVEPNYDTSTTITRAVKANDPSIIIRESGKSVDELCRLVDESPESCSADKIKIGCPGLSCYGHNCPFSISNGKTKESAKAWLRGNSSSKVESTSNTETMDTNQFRVRCIGKWEGFTIGEEYVFPSPIDDKAYIRGNIDNWDRWNNVFQKIEDSPTVSTSTNQSNTIKITDLKPGMWVRLKNRRGIGWNAAGYMDKYIGQVVQIKEIFNDIRSFNIQDINKETWIFIPSDIEEILKAHNPITSNNGVVTPVETLLPQPEIKEEFEVTKVQPLTRPKYIGRIN